MTRLNPEKLNVNYSSSSKSGVLSIPRRYTLTHSDSTGDIFLTVGPDYDFKKISKLYTRLMRDEVLAEWQIASDEPSLHVYCHVSGGLIFGGAGWRDSIFRSELPLVLEALRYGDRELFIANPELDRAPIWIHFQSSNPRYDKIEKWGNMGDFKI